MESSSETLKQGEVCFQYRAKVAAHCPAKAGSRVAARNRKVRSVFLCRILAKFSQATGGSLPGFRALSKFQAPSLPELICTLEPKTLFLVCHLQSHTTHPQSYITSYIRNEHHKSLNLKCSAKLSLLEVA